MSTEPILLVPRYFTTCEGGSWLLYTGRGFTRQSLIKATIGPPFAPGGNLIGGILLTARYKDINYWIHSLAFSEDITLDDFPRWDEYNGWTTPL